MKNEANKSTRTEKKTAKEVQKVEILKNKVTKIALNLEKNLDSRLKNKDVQK